MTMADIPLVQMLKTRLHWHQARQKVLAENVANANTPGFAPSDLKSPDFGPGGRAVGGGVGIARTSPLHLAAGPAPPGIDEGPAKRFETTPSGNAVNIEDEMMKVAQNQADYQLAATLYQKSLGLLRTAIGRRG